MGDPTVRVVPSSVRAYGSSAQEQFGNIRTSLESLCTDMVAVDYYGPNAVEFKTRCGQLAAELSNALLLDMGKIADAVKTTTTNIAASLGGPPVDIQFNGAQVQPPAVPAGDESVGVNLPALTEMKTTANTYFTAISDQFDAHLTSLQNTDWQGNAKTNAVGAVTGFTNSAKGKVEETGTQMATFIDQQVEATSRANQ